MCNQRNLEGVGRNVLCGHLEGKEEREHEEKGGNRKESLSVPHPRVCAKERQAAPINPTLRTCDGLSISARTSSFVNLGMVLNTEV